MVKPIMKSIEERWKELKSAEGSEGGLVDKSILYKTFFNYELLIGMNMAVAETNTDSKRSFRGIRFLLEAREK